MSELNVKPEIDEISDGNVPEDGLTIAKLAWETPKLEDVSEQVMAQPYIRFT